MTENDQVFQEADKTKTVIFQSLRMEILFKCRFRLSLSQKYKDKITYWFIDHSRN